MSAWRLGDENCGGGVNISAVVDGEDITVAWTSRVVVGGVDVVSGAQARANAKDIARRHNAHEDLVALAQRWLHLIDTSGGRCVCAGEYVCCRCDIVDTLARAGATT